MDLFSYTAAKNTCLFRWPLTRTGWYPSSPGTTAKKTDSDNNYASLGFSRQLIMAWWPLNNNKNMYFNYILNDNKDKISHANKQWPHRGGKAVDSTRRFLLLLLYPPLGTADSHPKFASWVSYHYQKFGILSLPKLGYRIIAKTWISYHCQNLGVVSLPNLGIVSLP